MRREKLRFWAQRDGRVRPVGYEVRMSMNLNPAKMPWMQSADVLTLFGAFPEGSLRFVGGCVRNALWNEPVGDIA